MSAYGIYDSRVDYMVCDTCKTEAFTWLAEVFTCSVCGEHEYVIPIIATMDKPREAVIKNKLQHAKYANTATSPSEWAISDFMGRADRKRKRFSSDEETA
jgi:uncharacterized Zn finger protein (UPF0148 family)